MSRRVVVNPRSSDDRVDKLRAYEVKLSSLHGRHRRRRRRGDRGRRGSLGSHPLADRVEPLLGGGNDYIGNHNTSA